MTSEGFGIEIEAFIGETMAAIGYVPPILAVAISERTYDAFVHHKQGVVKDAGRAAARGNKMRRFLAPMLGLKGSGSSAITTMAYTRKAGRVTAMRDVVDAESWGSREQADVLYRHDASDPRSVLRSAEQFAVPIADRYRQRPDRFREMLAQRKFIVVGKGVLLEIQENRDDGARRNIRERVTVAEGVETVFTGQRTEIAGVLRKSIRRSALFDFYGRWQRNAPKHLARMRSDVALAVSEAGREALASRVARIRDAQRQAAEARRAFLDRNPGKFGDADRRAREVKRAVLATSLRKGGA